ncbi:60Kd inner membrane family protein, partial [Candidatus Phytoplasma oryzae]
MKNHKNLSLKKILTFMLLSTLIMLIINFFLSSYKKKKTFINEKIECFFLKKMDSNELQQLEKKVNDINYNFEDLKNYLKVFRIALNKKKKIIVDNINSESFQNEKAKIKDYLEKVFRQEKFYFYYKKAFDFEKEEIKKIKDFFSIKMGSNLDYLKQKYFENESFLKIGILNNSQIIDIEKPENLKIYDNTNSIDVISKERYNKLIRVKEINNINNGFILKSDLGNSYFEIFVDDSGDLPIQLPYKLKWNFLLFWGYIWNVLLIFIGSLLYIFHDIFSFFSSEGIFFGNLGLCIILTTITIRTLLWPIYTKTSTFASNMSMAQPEINKIQKKYSFKKDPDSIKKMQLEIFKVYKKHNFSFFDIFVSFLQMPIFIAMFKTINRIRVKGGIFSIPITKPFLNFIYLNSYYDENYFLVKILLSCFVGISMFILNKINFKKTVDLSNKNKFLTLEQINKNKSQEK